MYVCRLTQWWSWAYLDSKVGAEHHSDYVMSTRGMQCNVHAGCFSCGSIPLLYTISCVRVHTQWLLCCCVVTTPCYDTLCNVTYCDLQFTWSYYSVSDVSNVMQLLQVLCTGTTRRGQYLKKRFRFVLQKHTCVFIPLTSLGDERGGHSLCHRCSYRSNNIVFLDESSRFSPRTKRYFSHIKRRLHWIACPDSDRDR